MTLPFDLPQVSRGFAALDAAARAAGREAALGAARAIGEVLGLEVRLAGAPRPAAPADGAAVHRLAVELAALPGDALLEVEPRLVARLVDALGGGGASPPSAAALTPLEETALELLVLAALDGARQVPAVDERLAPRLARRPRGGPGEATTRPAGSPLTLDLEIEAGQVRGRARLLLPPAAVLALRGPAALEEPLASLPLFASLRGGRAPLAPAELAALAPGDVVLTDPPADGHHRLVFPGGLTAVGPVAGGALTVERIEMDDRLAEIPVTLEVELARVPLTLADLARLAPGGTLPLHLDRRGLVTLRLGERALARGELVDVDGAVGVRILSMELAWAGGAAPAGEPGAELVA
jgi:type III secretion protein Q